MNKIARCLNQQLMNIVTGWMSVYKAQGTWVTKTRHNKDCDFQQRCQKKKALRYQQENKNSKRCVKFLTLTTL